MPPQDPSLPVTPEPELQPQPKSRRSLWLWVGTGILVLASAGAGVWYWSAKPKTPAASSATPHATVSPAAVATATGLTTLAGGKNYGNKYSNGLLPVGDKQYTTTAAKKGSIYLCHANFVAENQAGAQTRGPWFVNNNTQWDVNKKASVAGHVNWTPVMSMKLASGKRVITTNDLPNHYTGVFPVSSSDPAYKYDRNPSTIKSQSLTYTLDGAPQAGNPGCMGGEVGVMLTGAALFNGFDAGGRDAAAWEVQDGCSGHPQNIGEYHYHSLSRCITDTGVQTVLGFALDGFPITGPKVADNNILTTADLDECHGIVSDITLDGKKVTTYHYVMTQDFPYSVSCFRGTAVQAPGQPEHSGDDHPTGAGTPPPPPPGAQPPARQQ